MKKLSVFVFTSLLSLTTLSYADSYNNSDSSSSNIAAAAVKPYGPQATGLYGSAELGFGNTSALNSGVNSSTGGRIDVGYKINSYMGFEAGITGLTNPSAGNSLAPMQFYDASFVGTLPIGHRFDFHGQIGLAYGNMEAPNNSGGALTGQAGYAELVTMVGAGLDVYLTKNFALTANDYMYIGSTNLTGNDSIGNTNVAMGGVKYNF